MNRLLFVVDEISTWVGKTAGWCIVILTFTTSYEVFMRYLFLAPTEWAFDASYMLYGTLFMLAGAYTLSRNGHVRGDFIYRAWPPRRQATFDLVLYFLFFFPGVIALVVIGSKYAGRSWNYGEVSVNSPAGVPIFQFKTIIAAAGILLFIQGIAQVMRCIMCMRDGYWTHARDDIEETEVKLMRGEVKEVLEEGAAEGLDVVVPQDERETRR